MLVEMRRSAVLGRLGQVRGQLRLRQVQDRLCEVANGVEDTAWELRLQDGHLGSDEGRGRGLHRGSSLLRHRGWRWWGWRLLLLGRWGWWGLLGRWRGLLGPGTRGLLQLLVVVVMVLQTDKTHTQTDVRRGESPGPVPGFSLSPQRQVATTLLREDTTETTYLLWLPPRVPLLF